MWQHSPPEINFLSKFGKKTIRPSNMEVDSRALTFRSIIRGKVCIREMACQLKSFKNENFNV